MWKRLGQGRQGQELEMVRRQSDAQRGGLVSDKGECGRLREYSRKGSNMIYLTFADYFGCCVGDRIQKNKSEIGRNL